MHHHLGVLLCFRLGAITGDLQSILAKFNELDKKLAVVDERTKDTHSRVQNTAKAIQREG